MAAPARSAAQSAVSLNSHDAAKPQSTVSTLPRLKQWLAAEEPEYQRRSPPLALHLHLALAAQEAGSWAARRRELQSQGRQQSVRRLAATGAVAAAPTRVSGGKMTVTTQVARTGSRYPNRVKVAFGTGKEGSPLCAVLPNPSLEARPNSKTPGPRSGAGYYPHRGPGVLLLVPPQLER